MRVSNISVSASYESQNCCSCGIAFFLEVDQMNALKDNGTRFYCPNGHPMSFTDTLKKKNEDLLSQIEKLRIDLSLAPTHKEVQRLKDSDRINDKRLTDLTRAFNKIVVDFRKSNATDKPEYLKVVTPFNLIRNILKPKKK